MSVYFVRYGDSDKIKIGTARNAAERIRSLQCASPVKIGTLAVVDGDKSLEKAIHRRFAHLKVRGRGEWFTLAPDLQAFIKSPDAIAATERLNQRTKSIGAAQHLRAAWMSKRYASDEEMCWIFGMDAEILCSELGPSGRPEFDPE